MNFRKSVLFLVALLTGSCAWASATDYGYPILDPYAATILGTPRDAAAEPKPLRGANVRNFDLQVFPERKKPEVFWYDLGLRSVVAYQEKKAPLIFLIAGTGASFDSPKNRHMARAFYKAGFHVAAISSSTHSNFIISASSSGFPGHLADDSKDIYRVMELIMEEMGDRIEVSDYYVAGYSLGGAQAAFVSKLDEERGGFNFKKVLMINPPVSLYNSVNILDTMLAENIPGGLDNFNTQFDRYIFLPVVKGYEYVMPIFAQDAVSHFFSNLGEITNFINSALQLKPEATFTAASRFVWNSTIGVLGLMDPATSLMGLDEWDEDFGQTLGHWGVGDGPFLVLPFFGPSNLRDTTGLITDSLIFSAIDSIDFDHNDDYEIPYVLLQAINKRHETKFRYYETGSPFKYDLVRLLYTKKRELEIAK